jgi:hypothetical protein
MAYPPQDIDCLTRLANMGDRDAIDALCRAHRRQGTSHQSTSIHVVLSYLRSIAEASPCPAAFYGSIIQILTLPNPSTLCVLAIAAHLIPVKDLHPIMRDQLRLDALPP